MPPEQWRYNLPMFETSVPRSTFLRAATAALPFELPPESLRVTCSLGVAQRSAEDRDGGALMARADGALYAAKRGGRNQVVSDPPGG